MAELKPGHVNDFANSMAEAIENALAAEYQRLNGKPMAGGADANRQMLFAAIAQGVLGYLKANQNEFISSVTLQSSAGTVDSTVTQLSLNIDTS